MTEWCWRGAGSKIAHGPFDSRQNAIEAARGEELVYVSRIKYPDPGAAAEWALNMDVLLDAMEEYPQGAGCNPHGYFFSIDDTAEDALGLAVEFWATQHVRVTGWTTGDEEEIKL